MAALKTETATCLSELTLSAYLDGTLKGRDREAAEEHISSCDECLRALAASYEAVAQFKKKRKENIMKKINWYFVGMVTSFALSFFLARYFLQFLTAAIIFGAKWIIDSKNTRMLVMIYDAWRKGGEKEASRILENLKADPKDRF
jgi:hypothetical protein